VLQQKLEAAYVGLWNEKGRNKEYQESYESPLFLVRETEDGPQPQLAEQPLPIRQVSRLFRVLGL
jgi:hypothetical protein